MGTARMRIVRVITFTPWFPAAQKGNGTVRMRMLRVIFLSHSGIGYKPWLGDREDVAVSR